jgi:uncharacterized protein (DUF58 family)
MRVRPTGHALSFAAAVAMLMLAAITFQSNASWMVVQLVGVIGIISVIIGARNLRGVTVTAASPAIATAGQPAVLPLTLRHAGRWSSQAVVIEVDVDGVDTPTVWSARILPGVTPIAVPVTVPKAGVYRILGVRLRSVWPLGLAEVSQTADLPDGFELLVAPAPVATRPPVGVAGDDRDFAGHHAWRQGMPVAAIDWRAQARRGGEPQAKNFAAAGGDGELTYEDACAAAGADADHEHRLGVLVHWIDVVDRAGLAWAMRLPAMHLPSARGDGHRRACLAALARAADRT